MRPLFALLCLAAAPAFADTCPDPINTTPRVAELSRDANAARNQAEADVATREMWQLWTTAPDDRAQELLDEGMFLIRVFDLVAAIEVLDQLVAYCPDYAEGWNQRAFAHYLKADFEPALADLDEALARTPNHVGALSGKALSLIGLGQAERAQDPLREAVKLNPWIRERELLLRPLGEEL